MKKSIILFALSAAMLFISGAFSVKADSIAEISAELAAVTESNAGDVNDDGRVDRQDLLRLAKYFSGWNVTVNMYNSDVNADGKVNLNDILRFGKYLGGWNVILEKVDVPVPDPKPSQPEYDSDEEGWSGIYRP